MSTDSIGSVTEADTATADPNPAATANVHNKHDTNDKHNNSDDNDSNDDERSAPIDSAGTAKLGASYFDVDTTISGRKRQRKSVEKLSDQYVDPNDLLDDFVIEQGSGMKFNDITIVHDNIDKHRAIDLKKFYQAIYPQVKGMLGTLLYTEQVPLLYIDY